MIAVGVNDVNEGVSSGVEDASYHKLVNAASGCNLLLADGGRKKSEKPLSCLKVELS